jgi:hypothetical protein
MRELTALFAPTPNSYKRFTPYSWAGTSVSWGYENRSTGLRAITKHPDEARLEHRLPGAEVRATERPRGTRAAHECFARMSRRQRAGGVP